ncbi:hypothetical protein HK104_001008 [Borealophlyctis nickersoniae]|nr:hypothetical protein HK104_001008 [Borealophlyctis nickersoniae]
MGVIHERAKIGDLKGLQELLADPDTAGEGHPSVVDWALTTGVDPNAATVAGDTALILASAHGHLDVVKKLTAHGADVNRANDHGNTALHYACIWRFKDIALHLAKEANAHVAVKNKYHRTPLGRTSAEIKGLLADELKKAQVVQAKARTFAEAKEEAKMRFMAKGGIDWEISSTSVQIHEKLSSSASAEVFTGQWNGYTVAIKRPLSQDKFGAGEIKALKAEIQAIRSVWSSSAGFTQLCILTEYYPYGDAHLFLHDASIELSPAQAMRMAMEVVKGMMFLHEQNPPIYHYNLKTQNVMLIEDGSIKLTDYGFPPTTSPLHPRHIHPRQLRNAQWCAPELLSTKPEDVTDWAAVDVYAFGIMLFEIVTRMEPYAGMNSMHVGMKAKLMRWAWHGKAKERPTFKQAHDMLMAIKF